MWTTVSAKLPEPRKQGRCGFPLIDHRVCEVDAGHGGMCEVHYLDEIGNVCFVYAWGRNINPWTSRGDNP